MFSQNDSGGLWDLKKYSFDIRPKLIQILNDNIENEQCQTCAVDLISMEFDESTRLCPAIKYIFDHNVPKKMAALESLNEWVCHEENIGIIHDILNCDGLLSSIVNYKPNPAKGDSNEDDDAGYLEYGFVVRIIKEMLSTKYDIIGEFMLQNGILDLLDRAIISGMTGISSWRISECFEQLCKFNIPSKYLNDIRKYQRLMEIIEISSKTDYPSTHALLAKINKIDDKKEKCDNIGQMDIATLADKLSNAQITSNLNANAAPFIPQPSSDS